MPAVHFVERKSNVWRVPGAPGEWESGYWVVAEETAQRLVGGDIYLHSNQSEPAHFGGRIVSFRVHRDGTGSEIDGRVIFRFKATPEYKGVVAGREGWGNEKKLVWESHDGL